MRSARRETRGEKTPPVVTSLGSLSKSLRLVLLRLPRLKRSGESTSPWSAKFSTKTKETSAKEFKISFQFSYSQPNDLAQRTMAVIRLPKTNRLFLSESECHTLCTLDEIYNCRDKYLTLSSEEINTQRSKTVSYSYRDIKHLH